MFYLYIKYSDLDLPWQVEYDSHEDEIDRYPLIVRVVDGPIDVKLGVADVA